jgi:hypothetical protein
LNGGRHTGKEGDICQLVQTNDNGGDHTPLSDLGDQLNQVFAPLFKILADLSSSSINVN